MKTREWFGLVILMLITWGVIIQANEGGLDAVLEFTEGPFFISIILITWVLCCHENIMSFVKRNMEDKNDHKK